MEIGAWIFLAILLVPTIWYYATGLSEVAEPIRKEIKEKIKSESEEENRALKDYEIQARKLSWDALFWRIHHTTKDIRYKEMKSYNKKEVEYLRKQLYILEKIFKELQDKKFKK
jgi:hypothetical protein